MPAKSLFSRPFYGFALFFLTVSYFIFASIILMLDTFFDTNIIATNPWMAWVTLIVFIIVVLNGLSILAKKEEES